MRKFILILAVLIVGLAAASWIAWESKANLMAQFLSRHLHVPITIQTFDLSKTQANIDQFHMGNPPRSKTFTSFSAQTIDIASNLEQVLSNPLIINSIDIAGIFIGIEYYKDNTTNWDYILKDGAHKEGKKQDKQYLIRTLILENLTVEVTSANGNKKRYPTIARMEFHNISSESGLPIKEIEKAIFKLVMQDIFNKLNLFQQSPFQSLPNSSPLKYLPNLFN